MKKEILYSVVLLNLLSCGDDKSGDKKNNPIDRNIGGLIDTSGFKNTVDKDGFKSKGAEASNILKSSESKITSNSSDRSLLKRSNAVNFASNSRGSSSNDQCKETYVPGPDIYEQKLCDQNRLFVFGEISNECFYEMDGNFIYCMEDPKTNLVAQCVFMQESSGFSTVDYTKNINYVPGPETIPNVICADSDDLGTGDFDDTGMVEIEEYNYNGKGVEESDEYVADQVFDLIIKGSEDCSVVFSKIEKIFQKQKKELNYALSYLEEMQSEQERLKLHSSNGMNVNFSEKENAAISFEFGDDKNIFGSITGAANDEMMVIDHRFEFKDKGESGKTNVGFAADLSKNMIDYTLKGEWSVKNKEGIVDTYTIGEVVTTKNGDSPNITISAYRTVNEQYEKFEADIVTKAKNHVLVNAIGSSNEYPEAEKISFEVKKGEDGRCEILNKNLSK